MVKTGFIALEYKHILFTHLMKILLEFLTLFHKTGGVRHY